MFITEKVVSAAGSCHRTVSELRLKRSWQPDTIARRVTFDSPPTPHPNTQQRGWGLSSHIFHRVGFCSGAMQAALHVEEGGGGGGVTKAKLLCAPQGDMWVRLVASVLSLVDSAWCCVFC